MALTAASCSPRVAAPDAPRASAKCPNDGVLEGRPQAETHGTTATGPWLYQRVAAGPHVQDLAHAVDLALDNSTGCAVIEGGDVKCWRGIRVIPNRGKGTVRFDPKATLLPEVHQAVSITASENEYCAILRDRSVTCWRHPPYGDASTASATPLPGARNIRSLATLSVSSDKIGVTMDGELLFWGISPAVGFDSPASFGGPARYRSAVAVAGASLAQLGFCVLLVDGTVRCAGPAYVSNELSIPIAGAKAMYGGNGPVTCVTLADRSLWCWGHAGGIGDGSTSASTSTMGSPHRVLEDVRSASVGVDDACAVLGDGGARCWGSNAAGAIGDGTREPRFTPTPVCGLSHARAIAVGQWSCAIVDDGHVACWGYTEAAKYD